MTDELENALKQLPGAGVVHTRLDGYWMESADLNVLSMAELMKTLAARLTTISAVSIENGETEIIYHFAIGNQSCELDRA
jgi:hypothetical protein